MKVHELMEYLQGVNQNAEVVRFGHFGDPVPYEMYNIGVRNKTEKGLELPRTLGEAEYFQMVPPDIGEPPD